MQNGRAVLEDCKMEEERRTRRFTSTIKISLNEISEATKKSMKTRIITSVILAILVVPTLFLGGWYILGLILLVSIIAVFEIMRGARLVKRQWYIYLLALLSNLALTFWIFIKENINANLSKNYHPLDISKWVVEDGFASIEVSSFLLATILIGLFTLLVVDRRFRFDVGAYLFLLILFTGFGFQSFLFLRLFPQYIANSSSTYDPNLFTTSFLLIYVILGTIANDIGAYFIGVLFGKNKMIPRISPNKTWEGFVGGVVFSVLFSFLFAMIVSWLGYPILPVLDHNAWYNLLLVSFVIPLAANIGDLFFSATKRYLNMKDYGTALAGHGGVLDRIDSLLLVSVVTGLLVILINNGWDLLV